jgi:hypothetical protein
MTLHVKTGDQKFWQGSVKCWSCRDQRGDKLYERYEPLTAVKVPWRWRQYISPKLWYLPMSPHGITTQSNIDDFLYLRVSSQECSTVNMCKENGSRQTIWSFIYLGTTVKKSEVHSRWTEEQIKFSSEPSVLPSLIWKHPKLKYTELQLILFFLCGCQTWSFTLWQKQK